MTWPTRRRAGEYLAVGRTLAGAGAWLAPELSAHALGTRPRLHPPLPLALRLFGVRDVAMGLAYLTAGDEERDRWLAIGMAVDTADAAAALLAARRNRLPLSSMAPIAVTALCAVAVAGWARRG